MTVHDCSTKCEEKSLNDVIHPGPKLEQDLISILLRIRRYPIALVCDIAKMYLRIRIRQIDRPYQRILWRPLKQNEKPKVLQFTRVVFGINSSPFHAQFVCQEHAKKKKAELPEATETVLCPKFMDGSIYSKSNDVETIRLYRDLSKLWVSAGMYARK